MVLVVWCFCGCEAGFGGVLVYRVEAARVEEDGLIGEVDRWIGDGVCCRMSIVLRRYIGNPLQTYVNDPHSGG